MASTASVPLNAEPSQPDEREKQHLDPKSYVDAVQEEPPVNGNGTNGTSAKSNNATSESEWLKASSHKASVLRIVDTGAEGKEKETEKKGERPQYERQESKHKYSGAVRSTPRVLPATTNSFQGLDDTPMTPPKQKHRRQKSSSQEKKSADEQSKANGVDNAKNPKVKDDQKNTTVFEKVEGTQNGSKLISVKPDPEFEKQHRTDRKVTPKPSKEDGLASGKKPGQRWHQSGIRFAPLNVPLQRRLQTLVVLFHTLCIALSVSVFFFLCAIPLFWPLLIPYMIYCMTSTASTSGTLSHRSDFLRSLPVWSLFASYFPARLHRTQELPPTRKYIFGYHPHGILSLGAFGAFATEALGFSQLFPGIRNTLLTLDSNFRIPIYRDYALAMGIASVSKESCENLLSKGGPNKVFSSASLSQTSSLT